MMWTVRHGDEIYLYHNGALIFKRWLSHSRSIVLHGAFIAMLLMLSGVAVAQDVSLIVSPQTPIELGEPIELDATAIVSESVQWRALDCKSAQFRLRENGHLLSFWPRQAGIYRFLFIWIDAEKKLSITELRVTVLADDSRPTPTPGPQPGPQPGPGPQPLPSPSPRFPDQVLGLSTIAFDAGSKVPNAATDAAKLATAFRGVAAKVDAGALKGQSAIVAETRTANAAAISGDVTRILQWKDVTGKVLGAAMARLEADGKLKTDRDISDAWKEFATGLEAIK